MGGVEEPRAVATVLDDAALARLAALWDEAIALPGDQHACWFHSLSGESPAVLGALWTALQRSSDGSVATPTLLPALDLAFSRADERCPWHAGDLVGQYRLRKLIARGGSSWVWLGERHDGLLKRPVALKLPRSWRATSAARQRFDLERDILAGLAHPNIARLYDAGLCGNDLPYLALEYVDGVPISDFVVRGALDTEARMRLFLDVLRAVAFAHSVGVVHRDLKPDNILVTADGQVHLIDFGIAALLGAAGGTTIETSALTPEYAAPEQLRGEVGGVAADIYALGVVLYELLTQRRPPPAAHVVGAARPAVAAGRIVPPSELRGGRPFHFSSADVPWTARRARDLDALVMSAVQPDPADRYPSAHDFARAVQRFLAGDRALSRVRVGPLVNALAMSVTVVALFVAVASVREARVESRTAEVRADTNDQLISFVKSVFTAAVDAEPDPKGRRLLDAADLLRAGELQLDDIADDQFEAKSRLSTALAELNRAMRRDEAAESLHRRALALAERAPAPERDPATLRALAGLLPLLIDWGREEEVEQRLAQADALLDRLGAIQAATPAARTLRGQLELARAQYLETRDPQRGVVHADAAVRLLDGAGAEALRAEATISRAAYHLGSGEPRQAAALVTSAMRSLRVGSGEFRIAQQVRCAARLTTGDAAGALEDCQAAWARVRYEQGDANLDAANAAYNLAVVMLRLGRPLDARGVLNKQIPPLRAGTDEGTRRFLASLFGLQARAAVQLGDLTQAAQWLEEQRELGLPPATALAGSLSLVSQIPSAELALARSDLSTAEASILGGIQEHMRTGATRGYKVPTLLLLDARLELARGRPARALALATGVLHLVAGAASDEPLEIYPPERVAAEAVQVEALLESGDLPAAKAAQVRMAQSVSRLGEGAGALYWETQLSVLDGRIDLQARHAEAAYQRFDTAFQRLASSGDPMPAMRVECLLWRGLASAAQNRRSQARADLASAQAWTSERRADAVPAPIAALEQRLGKDLSVRVRP